MQGERIRIRDQFNELIALAKLPPAARIASLLNGSAGVPECFIPPPSGSPTPSAKKWDSHPWKRIGYEERQPATSTLEPILVALIDTGLDRRHPHLQHALWKNAKEIPGNNKDDDNNGLIDDVLGWNFAHGIPLVYDFHGHGTYTAGILAARPKKQGQRGVNPNVKLLPLKVTGLEGRASDVAVCKAIEYAVSQGAKILQISLCLKPRSKRIDEAVTRALAKGVLIVTCANSHSENTKNVSPASTPGVLTVGACTDDGKRAPFSGWGAHLDVVAPGMSVIGLRATGTDFLVSMTGKEAWRERSGGVLDHLWYVADGSCSALPQVTGTASLIWQREPKLTADQVRRKILLGCDDLLEAGWDRSTGYGRINVAKAMQADPDSWLECRITSARITRRDKRSYVHLYGRADAARFRRRLLQVAYGTTPSEEDWKTVDWSQTRVSEVDGLLATVPLSKMPQQGRWSVRCIAQDRDGNQRVSYGTVMIR